VWAKLSRTQEKANHCSNTTLPEGQEGFIVYSDALNKGLGCNNPIFSK
jgi:hypothetical protein